MSQSKVAAEGVDFAKVFNHRIKDYCKLFTNFVFLKNYIFIAHGHILSFYDILLKRFNDHHLEFKSDIEQVFRSKSPNTNEFVICVFLKNGDLEFLRSQKVRDRRNPREEIEIYDVDYDLSQNVGGSIIQFDQDRDENEWTFIVVDTGKHNYKLVCLHDQKLHQDMEQLFTDEEKQSLAIDQRTNFVFMFSPKQNTELLIHNGDQLYIYELQHDLQTNQPLVIPLEHRKNTWIDTEGKQKEVPFISGQQSGLHTAIRVSENDSLMILIDSEYFYVINMANLDEAPSKFKQMCIGAFVSDNNFMYTLSLKNQESNTASGFRLYDIENCISQVNRRNKMLKLQASAGQDQSGQDNQQDNSNPQSSNIEQSAINMKELMSYQLSSVQVGCQGLIDFSHQNQRLVYQSSFDQIDIVPLLHKNTIAFVGMDNRDQYLATKVIDDKFIALNQNNQLTTWSILTGKVLEPHFSIKRENVDFSNFEVYSFSEYHLAYYQEWATKVLLKCKNPMPNQDSIDTRDFFETKSVAPNMRNQTTFLEHKQKTFYEFRLIEIIDPYSVKEHYSFVFPYYDQDKFQHLLFNDKGDLMFERLKNARAFLYQKEAAPTGKQQNRVKWRQIRRFTEFPSDLVQCTSYPYIFSPDFSKYLDVDRKEKKFVLRDSRSQQILQEIPEHIMSCKSEDYQLVAARARWLDNNTLQFVNSEGIERKIDMSTSAFTELQFNVIPLFSEFKQLRDPETHYYLDQLQMEDTDSLTRLKVKYQAFKSSQLLDSSQQDSDLYRAMFTVDYNLEGSRGKFIADLSFSFLHWNLIEKLESGQIQLDQIDNQQFTKLIYNILPGGDTIFHRLAQNVKGNLIVQVANKCHPNLDKLPIPPTSIHMPFLDNFSGINPIEILNSNADSRTINQYLLYLAAYGIDHHSRSLVKCLPSCIQQELPNLTVYFNSRLIQTAQCAQFTKGNLIEQMDPPGITVAKYCLSDETENIIQRDIVESEINLQYFDVAMMHQFDKALCGDFYDALGDTGDMSIFENKGIQKLIEYRWPLVREYVKKRLFVPFVVFLVSVSLFMSTLYQYRLESDEKLVMMYYGSMVLLALQSLYFIGIEIYQLSKAGMKYFLSPWNYLDIIPPVLLMIFFPLALMGLFDKTLEDGTRDFLNLEATLQATINLLLWLKFLYFLRIYQGTGYLIKTIIAVVMDMRYFLFILFLTMMAFGDSFRAISSSNLPQNEFIKSWWQSFTYIYRMILGDFSTEVTVLEGGPEIATSYSSEGNGFGKIAPYYCWFLFYMCSVLNIIIMMNLLVAIISDSFKKINTLREQANYQEKCDIIAENTYLVPKTRKVNFCPPNRYLLIATDKKQELGQQVRDTNFLVKDTHRKIAESHSQMERRLAEQIDSLKLRNERFLAQRLEKIENENAEIIKMLRKEVRNKNKYDDDHLDNNQD